MNNKWIRGDKEGKKIAIIVDSTFTYNAVVCVLSQVNDLVERLENILFMVDIEEEDDNQDIVIVMEHKVEIESYLKECVTLLAISDLMIGTYSAHFSEENEDDGEELLDRHLLLIGSIEDYEIFFKKLKSMETSSQNAVNDLLKNIGGIENLN